MLEQIVEQRRADIRHAKECVSIQFLQNKVQEIDAQYGNPMNVIERLRQPSPSNKNWHNLALAAEFKRASPSKGSIALKADIVNVVNSYAMAGCSMISILTEPKWFKGSLLDLEEARKTVTNLTHDASRPVLLRKDFVIDTYQILEARAHGADCVLLIVAVLTFEELELLIKATLELDMYPLVEVNSVSELDIALKAKAKLIGVNNRNLRTFKLDKDTAKRVSAELKARGITDVTLLVLSGIHTNQDVSDVVKGGAQGILVGEFLMKSLRIEESIDELMSIKEHESIKPSMNTKSLVKVCGITNVEDAFVALRSGADMIGIIFAAHSPRNIALDTAKEIVHAVRAYGEREGPILPRTKKNDHGAEWFTENAIALRQACASSPLVVGVFANQSHDFINEIVASTGIDLVQLHGYEDDQTCLSITSPTILVLHVNEGYSCDGEIVDEMLKRIQNGTAHYLLLDTESKGQRGGTGVAFDWSIAARFARAGIPCLMAGGLRPENVQQAISIARPLGVDVSSGVEKEKGVKDHEKVELFVRLVHDCKNDGIKV